MRAVSRFIAVPSFGSGPPDDRAQTVVSGGTDPATEILALGATHDTRRVLIPLSVERLLPNAYARLTQSEFEVVAPGAATPTKATPGPVRSRGFTRMLRRADPVPTALASTPMAAGVPASELRRLAQIGTVVDVARETNLIRMGDRGRQCLILLEGSLTVERDGQRLAEVGAGEIVGEMALLTGQRCNANVVATENSSVLAMNRREFVAALDACPTIARNVMQTALKRMPQVA